MAQKGLSEAKKRTEKSKHVFNISLYILQIFVIEIILNKVLIVICTIVVICPRMTVVICPCIQNIVDDYSLSSAALVRQLTSPVRV